MGLLYGENCMILPSTVLATYLCDRRTGDSTLCMLSRANKIINIIYRLYKVQQKVPFHVGKLFKTLKYLKKSSQF